MAEAKLTPEQEAAEAASLQKDVEAFNAELIPLLGKYNVGLGATVFVNPDGRLGGRPTLFRAPSPEKKPEQGNAGGGEVVEKPTLSPMQPNTTSQPLESSEA